MRSKWIDTQLNLAIRLIAIGIVSFGIHSLDANSQANATPPITIVKIEEDWEMILIDPSPENNSPQVTFFTLPSEQQPSRYFQTQMNYAAENEFTGGGFHVAAVLEDSYFDEARSGTRRGFSTDADTITWTTVMAHLGDEIVFAIKDGHCTDWGDFGGPAYLVRLPADDIDSLNHYRPEHSLESIDIGFGSNRVDSVQLKTIRVFYNNGQSNTYPVNQFFQR